MNRKEFLNEESLRFNRLEPLFKDITKDYPIQAHDYMIIENPNFKGKILDAGAGPCILPIVAKLKYPQLDIHAMDGSKLYTEIGRILASKCKIELPITYAIIEENPFLDEEFDTIVLNHIIEHIKDLDMVFDWCDRILKKDGTILIAVPYLNAHWAPDHVHFFDVRKRYENTTNIIEYLLNRNYKIKYKVFDEELIDKRHPHKSRGQHDMFIEVKYV
jgi:2-polyprenyl-3-methyl-5-hydroxy-6-metoxy-1,4-benzoquinol methylase